MKNQILWIVCLILASSSLYPALGATKKKVVKKSSSSLEEVTGEVLFEVLDDNDEAIVLFYEDDKSPKSKKLISTLEKLDLSATYPDLPFVRCSDTTEASEFGVKLQELPQIIFFSNGIPDKYEGN